MLIQEYLRGKPDLKTALLELEQGHAIYARPHTLYPNIINLNYDQIEAKNGDPLVDECRSIILDTDDNYRILARGYKRFYNYGQVCAAEVNWEKSQVFMKLDGSYCQLWWNPYENNWNVGTRGLPDAAGEVNGYQKTFQQLFWETFNALGYTLPEHKNYTLIFELMRPENRVVCRYSTNRLVLHGIRDITESLGYPELTHDQVKAFGAIHKYEVVKVVKFDSIEEVVTACISLDPLKEEGFIVCDDKFNRVKIKSAQYLALHSMRDGFGPKRCVEMIRHESSGDWVEYFPEFKSLVDEYTEKYRFLVDTLKYTYSLYKHIESQKEFALAIAHVPFSGALFQLRRGTVASIQEYLRNININNLLDYFQK